MKVSCDSLSKGENESFPFESGEQLSYAVGRRNECFLLPRHVFVTVLLGSPWRSHCAALVKWDVGQISCEIESHDATLEKVREQIIVLE